MDNPTARSTSRRHSGGGGGREDCWSEGGTETLIEAWGDRYLQLNRGNLRQKDWKEVADAVNANRDGSKAPRTDIQCKNRIDTLKKKYKLERAKPLPSKWPFFNRIEHLIGINNAAPLKKRTAPSATRSKSKPISNSNSNPNPNRNHNAVIYSAESSMPNSSGSNESSLGGGAGRELRVEDVGFTEETAHKELARAILRFGEIYERIESSKQQQMMELEKQRMEFTKSLEFERLNMFLESQFKLERMKMSSKRSSTAGKKL